MDCGIGCATYRCVAAERSSVVVAGFSAAERSADVVRIGGLEEGEDRARRRVRRGSLRVGSLVTATATDDPVVAVAMMARCGGWVCSVCLYFFQVWVEFGFSLRYVTMRSSAFCRTSRKRVTVTVQEPSLGAAIDSSRLMLKLSSLFGNPKARVT